MPDEIHQIGRILAIRVIRSTRRVISVAASAVFPSEISLAHAGEKPSVARLKTCTEQYHANTTTNSNGGLKWNAYWKECKKRLKG